MDTNRIATNKFEEVGIELQKTARNFRQAQARFEKSCTLCCQRNREGDFCKECPIRQTMLDKADDWHYLRAEDYLWIEMERASC